MVYVYHNKCDQKEHKKKVSSAKAPKNNVCDKHMEFAFKSCPTCLRQYERQMKGFINFFYREVANAEDLKGLQRAYDEYEQEKKVCWMLASYNDARLTVQSSDQLISLQEKGSKADPTRYGGDLTPYIDPRGNKIANFLEEDKPIKEWFQFAKDFLAGSMNEGLRCIILNPHFKTFFFKEKQENLRTGVKLKILCD